MGAMENIETAKRWYLTGRQVQKEQGLTTCTCCGRDIVGDNNAVRMLELDQRTNTYHDLGGVPENRSQGWFPFGLTCAKKLVKAHRAKTEQ